MKEQERPFLKLNVKIIKGNKNLEKILDHIVDND